VVISSDVADWSNIELVFIRTKVMPSDIVEEAEMLTIANNIFTSVPRSYELGV